MASDTPLSVLFLWHQHQPLYKDVLTNRYELPWVRLHATKDYYDMVALLDEFPSIKANFNLVPSLLTQLDDYAQGKAQDTFLELTLKRAADLTFEDQQFVLQNFFMAHWEHMVDPHKRYRELLEKRGRVITPESLSRSQKTFKEQDWRDLQTWFNLTWCDPLWREKDPFIKGLFEKGKHFTEEDKQKLIDKQREICGLVVAKHKEVQDRGQIEVTTTPYYHPILPLLVDTEAARMAMPHVELPRHRFQHPEDAREQVRRAIEDYAQRFGHAPQGMWPAEGSVSEEAARILAEMGIRWIATDEAVLAHSLSSSTFHRDDIYESYRLPLTDKALHFFFRDHELSDAIGFVYASWDPEEAAKDFMRRLQDIKARCKRRDGDKPRPHVVSVILDGENCWEYYKEDGLPFLRALYAKLTADSSIQTVRASDYLDQVTETKTLSKLWSGSWINGNFAIWIGHSEDNSAWDLLYRTRLFLQNTLEAHPERKDEPPAKQAWEEIYIAEGSDWCWWYGDDHSSSNDETFDYLFRKHLMNVYSLLGEPIPEDLRFPIKKKRIKAPVIPPVDFITPELDGRVTNFFEWQSAGLYKTEAGSTGTMHKSENLIKTIYYGFDLQNIYFRLDTNQPLTPELLRGISLKLIFTKPEDCEILATFSSENKLAMTLNLKSNQTKESEILFRGVYKNIIEMALPLNGLANTNKEDFEISVVVLRDGLEQERWPSQTTLHIPYPNPNVFVENWHI
jgi:alpha-amylase/alpha-mannosidase (GH57 family)